MASSSLVVRISADINDFAKQLRQMTREVDEAAKKVSEVGKALSLSAHAAARRGGARRWPSSAWNSRQRCLEARSTVWRRGRGRSERDRKDAPGRPGDDDGTDEDGEADESVRSGRRHGRPASRAVLGEILKMAATLQAANPGTSMDQATDALMRGLSGSGKALLDLASS
jgi:hypothetical protein